MVVSPSPAAVVVVGVVVSVPVVVVSVPEVVGPGIPISVVDSGTLVVKVVEVSEGVTTNGRRSVSVLGVGGGLTAVVKTGGQDSAEAAGGEGGRGGSVPGLVVPFRMSRHGRRS